MSEIKTVGIIGTGVIGAGWASRFLSWGLDVIAWDPSPNGEEAMRAAVANAWPSCVKFGVSEGSSPDRLKWASSLEEVCKAADFIQESAPERIELKQKLHADMDAIARPDVIIASSSSGLLPTEIQENCQHPERIMIGHPFNPVYLLPLCEVVSGEKTSEEFAEKAMEFYTSIGMESLRVKKEVEGYLSDRLQEAMWREMLHIVDEGVASTEDLDKAINFGPGLRWAIMGTFEIFHMAGGDAGMRHFMEQFGPALKLPWTKLVAPELTDDLIDTIVEGTEVQAAGRSVKEMEQLRDACLIAIMNTLREFNQGAGNIVSSNEARRLQAVERTAPWVKGADIGAPLQLHRSTVKPEWVDYNGHMSEAEFITAFGWASDALFRYIGDDEAYRASGLSFYTVETHINYYLEAHVGDPLRFETQLLGSDEKRMHLFHKMYNETTGDLLATTEQMLLHVDMNAAKAAPMRADVMEAVHAITAAHAGMDAPSEVGHVMEIKKKS